MTRKRRTRVLILGDPALRRALAAEIRALSPPPSIEVLREPRLGLVLITVRESARRGLFHLGEVLVSEARVRVEGIVGVGLIQGRDLQAAADLAVIDAAWVAGLPLTQGWEERLLQAEAQIEAALDREQASLATTRVDFETLDSGVAR